MTSAIARPTPPEPRFSRTAPVARIDLGALRLNLRAVLSSGRTGIIDLRADAWGHGIGPAARAALDVGAAALLVDSRGAAALGQTVASDRLVRTGVADTPDAVYGLTPGFAPVMSLRGRVLSLKPLRAGEGVSYGYTHRAMQHTTVALVTGGYAQGVVRAVGNSAHVSVHGGRRPIVGRVAMDVCVVDVGWPTGGGGNDVRPGDEVILFGAGAVPTLEEWTAASGLCAAELVTAVGLRAEREYTS